MNYVTLLASAEALLKDEPNTLSLLSNASAFLKESIENLNWVGFYLFDGEKLTLGPFQGKVACNIIYPEKGVVGTGFSTKEIQVVPDVSKIENHIYCDPLSMSEVVLPIISNDQVWGVLDLDAPIIDRFDEALVEFLKDFTKKLVKYIDFNKSFI